MNVQDINFTQFLDYFTTWYPLLVPAAILSIVVLGCIIDWIRVFLASYVDDFETQVEYKWWKWVGDLMRCRIIYDTWCGGDKRYYWITNTDNAFGKFSGFTNRNKAEEALKSGNHYNRAVAADVMSSSFDFKLCFGWFKIPFIITVGLIAFKLLPLVITTTIAIGYVVLLTARSIVRLTKKFKAHINDVNAHEEVK